MRLQEHSSGDIKLIFTKSFIFITLLNFIVMLADYQFFVTSAYFAIKLYGVSLNAAAISAGIFTIGCLVARFIMGDLVGILGAKRALILSTLAYLASALLVFIANAYALFVVERFLFGAAIGCVSTVTGTVVAYTLPPRVQGLGISVFSISTALALALGPFIGITLAETLSPTAVNYEVSVLCALGFILTVFLPRLPEIYNGAHTSFFDLSNFIDVKVLKIACIALIVPLGYGCVTAYLASMCEERGMEHAAGLFFLTASIMTILSRPFAGRLFDVAGENLVIYPAILAAAIALIVLAFAPSPLFVALAGIIHGLGFGNFQSSGQALALKLVDKSRYAQATSTFFIFWDLSLGIAPIIFGPVAAAAGFSLMFLILSSVVFAGLVLYYFLHGRIHPLKKPLLRPRRH